MSELHIEGMDCTGKSATAHEIGLLSDVERRHRVLTADNPFIAEFRARQGKHPWDSAEVTEGLLDAIDYDLANYAPSDTYIIQESTLVTKGLAMRIVAGAPKSVISKFEDRLAAFPKFESSVYMTVSDDVRLKRFYSRLRSGGKITQNDRMIINDFDRFKRIDAIMYALTMSAFGASEFDTSDMTPYESAVAINPFARREEVSA